MRLTSGDDILEGVNWSPVGAAGRSLIGDLTDKYASSMFQSVMIVNMVSTSISSFA